jgi:hypothetical protein
MGIMLAGTLALAVAFQGTLPQRPAPEQPAAAAPSEPGN